VAAAPVIVAVPVFRASFRFDAVNSCSDSDIFASRLVVIVRTG
jgi:hypothetical protein